MAYHALCHLVVSVTYIYLGQLKLATPLFVCISCVVATHPYLPFPVLSENTTPVDLPKTERNINITLTYSCHVICEVLTVTLSCDS